MKFGNYGQKNDSAMSVVEISGAGTVRTIDDR